MRATGLAVVAAAGLAVALTTACGSRDTHDKLDGAATGDGPLGGDAATKGDGAPVGDLGPTTGALTCSKYTMPPFSRACASKADCVLVTHTSDCCGTGRAIGLNKKDESAFKAEEQKCAATYPACGCAAGPTGTDDGSKAPMTGGSGGIAVDCVGGVCTSYVAACGGPCAGAPVCKTCVLAPSKLYAACSIACTGDDTCAGTPKLPHCVTSSYGDRFCAASASSCTP